MKANYNSYTYIKVFFFIIFFFPYLMHIHGSIFDLLYLNNIAYISIFILVATLFMNFYENRKLDYITYEKKLLYIFILLIFAMFVSAIFTSDYNNTVRNLFYLLIFFLLYNKFNTKFYFIGFVNLVTFFTTISVALYAVTIINGISLSFSLENLNLLTINSPFLTRGDWDYTLPYYLAVIPSNLVENNILGLPRFFGFSTEPSSFSTILLPTIIMALYYSKYIQSFILILALLLASSYGALFIGLLTIVFYLGYNYKGIIFFVTSILFILAYIFGLFDSLLFSSPRTIFYIGQLLNLTDNITHINLFNFYIVTDKKLLQIPIALIYMGVKYGLVILIIYCIIFYYYIKFSLESQNRYIFAFAIASLLIINKGGEVLTPFFLFCFSFIYSNYLNTIKKNDIIKLTGKCNDNTHNQ